MVALVTLVVAVARVRGLYPFLAITNRTSGEIMVVEGWIRSDSVEQASRVYDAAKYRGVLVSCGGLRFSEQMGFRAIHARVHCGNPEKVGSPN